MSAARKFDDETRARAVRMYQDRLQEPGESELGACKHVGALLGINPATLRNWTREDERSASSRGSSSSAVGSVAPDAVEELRELRRENAELCRANEILKTASAFFAQAELDRRIR
ncbi:transposase [Actinomycetes bacterium KLBMP 9759]